MAVDAHAVPYGRLLVGGDPFGDRTLAELSQWSLRMLRVLAFFAFPPDLDNSELRERPLMTMRKPFADFLERRQPRGKPQLSTTSAHC